MLSHQKLEVYQCAIKLLPLATNIASSLPTGYSSLADQLRRASISIPLNIAEGVGKHSPKDQRRFFAIARGSTLESAAIVDSCRALELIPERTVTEAEELLERIVAMLTKMMF